VVPVDTDLELVEAIRAKVPIVTGASALGAPLAMDFSMTDGPPVPRNGNYFHSWLQDTVEAYHLLLDKIVCFAMSDFGEAHVAFRFMITCAVRSYGFLLRLVIDGIVDILQAHFAAISGIFRTRGLRKQHLIRRYSPDGIIDP
jgi:hypothetical protein